MSNLNILSLLGISLVVSFIMAKVYQKKISLNDIRPINLKYLIFINLIHIGIGTGIFILLGFDDFIDMICLIFLIETIVLMVFEELKDKKLLNANDNDFSILSTCDAVSVIYIAIFTDLVRNGCKLANKFTSKILTFQAGVIGIFAIVLLISNRFLPRFVCFVSRKINKLIKKA